MIGWPVPLLRKLMSSRDVAEAMAYQRINPHTQERADLRAGIIASTLANINRGKNSKAYKPRDFMPDYKPKPKTKISTVSQQILEFFKIDKQS